jgi:eukaryotic-like serine/threonine-protein kinase
MPVPGEKTIVSRSGVRPGPGNSSDAEFAFPKQIGDFKLIEPIGEGGMGIVYLAEQNEPLRRQVALKIIKPGLASARFVARFEAERQALALMDHPNISRVLDAGVADDDRPYFVMELALGLSITEYCDRRQMSVRERARLMVDVCRAVQHAHHKGIIHRDIKPSNVLVVDSDRGPIPKVIDFGVAKAIEAHDSEQTWVTLDGDAVGTPLHMSPEQTKTADSDIDTRTDVYSLGVLLYELVTGTTPIMKVHVRHLDLQNLRRLVQTEEPPKPSARLREVGEELPQIARNRGADPRELIHAARGDLDQIITKAISKNREDRYATANGLARDLERYLDWRPIEAATPSNLYRLRRFAQRHKTALATLVLIVGVVLAALVYGLWKAHETADALKQAEASKQRLGELLYVSDMKLASDAWNAFDTPRVAALLQRHIPLPGESDFRRFEWHYLARLVGMESSEIDLAQGDVESLRFSPDGKWLAAGSRDSKLRIYPWKPLGVPMMIETGQGWVNDIAFAPDGHKLATAGSDGTLCVWEFAQEKLQPASGPFHAHEGGATSVAFAAEGALLITCGFDKGIRLWNADRLLSAKRAAPDELLVGTLEGHERCVEALSVSPDGWQLASASSDASLRLWDLKQKKHIRTVSPSRFRVVCAAWSHDGRIVAAGDIMGNVSVYDRETDSSRVLVRLLDGVESVMFLQGDQWLATGDRGGSIQLWPLTRVEGQDERHVRETHPRWQAHTSRVTSLALSPDGSDIISGSRSGQIRRWSAYADSARSRWIVGGIGRAYDFAFADRGMRLVVAGEAGLELWDLRDRKRVATWGEGQGPWLNAAMAPDGDIVVAGNATGEIVAWRLRSQPECRKKLGCWTVPGAIPWEHIAFAPDGRRFAAAAWDRREEIWVFDLDAPARCWKVPAKQSKCAAFSHSGRRLAVANMDDGLLYAWETQTKLFHFRGHSNTLSDLAFGPDGAMLATVGHDRTLRLWDLQETPSATERYAIVAHRDWVRSVAFSPDGWSLITSGDDGRVRLWHTETGQLLLELPDEGEGIEKARISAAGWFIACLTADDRIIIYDACPQLRHPP